MINQSKKCKIAIVAYNLDYGGLAKVITNLFLLLKDVACLDVELVLLDDNYNEEFSDSVVLFGFNSNTKATFYKKVKKYYLFSKHLRRSNLDFIIDLRYRINPITEILITKFLYPKTKILYTVHSSKIETYLPKNKILTKQLYGSSYKIVCVSKENAKIVKLKHSLTNITTIYNPLNLIEIEKKSKEAIHFEFDYILAVGRLVALKQFDKLIKSYSKSILPNKGVKLVIVGEGPELEKMKDLANKFDLSNDIIFIDFTDNPYKYMKKAKFLILCSKYEGFGIVLAEALACETPVISFDLVSGPSEIITNKYNGLLVENQNFDKLTEAINELYTNENLYHKCKLNAKESILKFSFEQITKDWLNLMQIQ